MKHAHAVSVCILLLLVSACSQKVNDPADVEAIKKMIAEFEKQTNARTLPEFVPTHYASDAVRLRPNGTPCVGIEAIRKLAQDDLEPNTSIKETDLVQDVLVSGDLAVARGTFTWTAVPKASGVSTFSTQGNWAGAFRRQGDGTWRCVYDIWNEDQPLPGSTATGEDEQALYQLERGWAEAVMKKDATFLEKTLAEDFVNNQGQNKRQAVAAMKNNPASVESLTISDMKAMVFGDTAVVYGIAVGKTQSAWMDVFVKRDGRWQCVYARVASANS